MDQDQLSVLKQAPVFQGIDEIVLEHVAQDSKCRMERYVKGQHIYDLTHFRPCFGILLSGAVLCEKPTADGSAILVANLKPGDCFGAEVLYGDRAEYPFVLTAQQETEILMIPQAVLSRTMRRNFQIAENYVRYLTQQLWLQSQHLSVLTAGPVLQRLSAFLLNRADAEGSVQSSMISVSRQLHIGRASLYRAMEELKNRGLVRKEGKTLTILDQEGLRRICVDAK